MPAIAAKVTSRGVLVPRSLMASWGNVHQVEIELQGDVVVIKPSLAETDDSRTELIDKLKAVGLIEDVSWESETSISDEDRAHLAKVFGNDKPLSEMIIEDREQSA